MNVSVEDRQGYTASLKVELAAEAVDRAFTKALREVGKKVRVPGFRPGHVPAKLIERQFPAELTQAAAEAAVEQSLWEAIAQSKLEPVAQPRLQLASAPARGETFTYRVHLEVQPEVVVTQLEGLKVKAVEEESVDKVVETELERLRNEAADMQPVSGRTTVEKGDFVLLDYKGELEGKPLAGGADNNALVEVGSSGWIPGFTEGLIGAEVPGETSVEAKFPDDYGHEEVRGKVAHFTMTLKEIKERKVPDLTDAFAQDLGDENLAATKARLEKKAAEDQKRKMDSQRRRFALEALVAANSIEVPPSRVDEQVEFMLQNFEHQMRRAMGSSFNLTDSDRADLRSERRGEAEFLVRAGLLLGAAANKFGLEVQDDEVAREIERLAGEAQERAPQVRAAYSNDEARRQLAFRMTEDKVVERILATAQ